VQSQKRNVGHLHHLETNTGNITHGVSLSTESRHQNLIVFLLTCVNPVYLNEVQAAVVGDESCDLLTVLDQLDPDALSDGRVGLLGFNHNAFGVRSSTEGVGLQSGAQMGLLVLFIMPFLYAAVVPQFSSSTQSTTLASTNPAL
uniref:Uncharacterized protein n=1 Tax=Sinocyclocheilus anshuiensis TaxID=1608454 RepID=A0A671QJ70_9TELE